MNAESRDKARRVLIVDDSFLMRRVIRNIIERDPGLEVIGEAADGIEALEQVASLDPQVILLDIEMPRMDGIEFLRRAQLITDACVIVISSVAQLGSPQAMEVLALGAADILPKPSGVLSVDFEEQRGHALLDAIARCAA
jgi:two-component system chemotaxis response regulator CheB